MKEEFLRTALLIGNDNVEKLHNARVAVFGVGGVGGYVVETLVRSGVGALELIDNDVVSLSNINRQIIALHSTVGQLKTHVAKARALDINPDCKIVTRECFFLPENADTFDFSAYDYVVDAIDTVSGKIALIERAKRAGVPVISAMGAGNKCNPTAFKVADVAKTNVCPLARVMRRELKKRGIDGVKCVYSEEVPIDNRNGENRAETGGKIPPASIAFAPSVMGIILASEVVKDIIAK